MTENRCMIITGGETSNKGAQSMLFITVSKLKEMFPEREIVVSSTIEFKKDNIYNYTVLPSFIAHRLYGLEWLYRIRNPWYKKSAINILLQKYKNCAGVVDISGYMFSSQRGLNRTIRYIINLKTAKKYQVPVYLMPQSFGPFEYRGGTAPLLRYLIKKYIKYPKVIYCRENEGYDYLCDFTKANLRKSLDLVLLSEKKDFDYLYKHTTQVREFNIEDNSVAIIPNKNNGEQGSLDNIISMYKCAIDNLLNKKKTIYVIMHSLDDAKFCQLIKDLYKENKQVKLISEDLSFLEFEKLISQFDYAIASRYHSIIHSYKNGIPCIAIGWATKYHELLNTFYQNEFVIDVRDESTFSNIDQLINKMEKNYLHFSQDIRNKLRNINKDDIFSVIE